MSMSREILSLRNAMDQLFQDSFNRMQQDDGPYRRDERYLVPRTDAWETENEVVIEMVLPGVQPDDVDITFEQDTLTVSGTMVAEEQEGRNWIMRERPRGPFRRRFTLQLPIDASKAEATYRNGLLILTLPKSEETKPRKIEVRSG